MVIGSFGYPICVKTHIQLNIFLYDLYSEDMKNLLLGLLLIVIAQIGAWIQQFAPMKWPWFKENTWASVLLIGVPISYFFIWGAQYLYSEFSSVWSVRLIQFSVGILVVLLLTYFVLNEGLSLKTILSLILAFGIILIQVLIK